MWNECKDLQEYIVGLRRDLHQIPELGLHLPETAAYVTTELDKIGIPYICSKKDSGIIATIKGGKPGKTICLRADMDALQMCIRDRPYPLALSISLSRSLIMQHLE